MPNFETHEAVRCFTKFYDWQKKFWLPDEVIYYGEQSWNPGYSTILWHGTTHTVKTSHIHKLPHPKTKRTITP